MRTMKGELLEVKTSDGLLLHGFLVKAKKDSHCLVLVIHGRGGNFYHDPWVFPVHNAVISEGWDFLTVNNRYHDEHKSWNEIIEDCVPDISAWMKYSRKNGYKKIILLGHSLGTNKIVCFYHSKKPKGLSGIIFLSPTDTIDTLKEWYQKKNKYLPLAKKMIKNNKGNEWLPKSAYYKLISADSYYSFFKPNSWINIFNFHDPKFNFKRLKNIKVPALAVTGTRDYYLKDHQKEMRRLEKIMPNCQGKVIIGADHWFTKHGKQLLKTIGDWLRFFSAE